MLFLTHREHRDTAMTAHQEPGVQAWHAVELCLNVPFYVVDIGRQIEDMTIVDHMLLHDASDLAALVQERNAGTIDLVNAYVVFQPQTASMRRWQMHPIREVWCRRGKPALHPHNLKYVTDEQVLEVHPANQPGEQWTLLAKVC